ncbi:helix-turn-helix domain-containing protein [Pseudomonas sp. F1_0610]
MVGITELSLDERIRIRIGLLQELSLREIARLLRPSPYYGTSSMLF